MDDQQFVEYGNVQAPQIDGWFFPPDMLAFFFLAGIRRSLGIAGSLCELGVWHGNMHQLVLFAPFVLPGGTIVMDDYHGREFPGIESATLDSASRSCPRPGRNACRRSRSWPSRSPTASAPAGWRRTRPATAS